MKRDSLNYYFKKKILMHGNSLKEVKKIYFSKKKMFKCLTPGRNGAMWNFVKQIKGRNITYAVYSGL